MHLRSVISILGFLLMLFSVSHLTPMIVSFIYQDGNNIPFFIAFSITLLTGLCFWYPLRRSSRNLRYRDGFLVVVLFWAVLASFAAIPFLFTNYNPLSITNAFFESMSGLTTTGATIFTNIDDLPPSILFYRQQLQWLGGMGIVVLAVAVMPMLGIGGMQLYRAETPGPMKDNKLTPRITESAKALWYIYLGLTVSCATCYYFAGMGLFDAICHAFSTISIGGFSTHDESIAYFNSPLIESITLVYMLIAAANFSLHFLAWRHRSIAPYFNDSEYRFFLAPLCITITIVTLSLISHQTFPSTMESIRHGLFQSVSIFTTTGYTSSDFSIWPTSLPVVLLLTSFIGGCAGSTAGGIKVMRIQMLYKQSKKEIVRLVHPNAVLSIKIGDQIISDKVINTVTGFISIYLLCFVVTGVVLSMLGLDWITAFSAAIACLNNLGPALGEATNNYESLDSSAKWILAFTMLLGRLELFTILVLFTVTFWRD